MNCDLNYEAINNRVREEIEKAKCEITYMRERAREAEQENIILRAKVEMVELIFGGRCRKCNSQ